MNKIRKGSHITEKHKTQISAYQKGRPKTEEQKTKTRSWWTEERRRERSESMQGELGSFWGKHHTLETIEKIRNSKLGKTQSLESNQRRSQTQKGRKFTLEHRAKMSANHRDQWGAKNHNWRGGISFLPYPPIFNAKLKAMIRERDNFICQKCNLPEAEEEYSQNLAIHHINYDKINNQSLNLITLCRSCNTEVNYNRDYWTKTFQKMLEFKDVGYK